jgi:hypothetical protein
LEALGERDYYDDEGPAGEEGGAVDLSGRVSLLFFSFSFLFFFEKEIRRQVTHTNRAAITRSLRIAMGKIGMIDVFIIVDTTTSQIMKATQPVAERAMTATMAGVLQSLPLVPAASKP